LDADKDQLVEFEKTNVPSICLNSYFNLHNTPHDLPHDELHEFIKTHHPTYRREKTEAECLGLSDNDVLPSDFQKVMSLQYRDHFRQIREIVRVARERYGIDGTSSSSMKLNYVIPDIQNTIREFLNGAYLTTTEIDDRDRQGKVIVYSGFLLYASKTTGLSSYSLNKNVNYTVLPTIEEFNRAAQCSKMVVLNNKRTIVIIKMVVMTDKLTIVLHDVYDNGDTDLFIKDHTTNKEYELCTAVTRISREAGCMKTRITENSYGMCVYDKFNTHSFAVAHVDFIEIFDIGQSKQTTSKVFFKQDTKTYRGLVYIMQGIMSF
jgi:hypothetical protein